MAASFALGVFFLVDVFVAAGGIVFNWWSLSNILLCFGNGGFYIYCIVKLKRFDPAKGCKRIGSAEFLLTPLLTLALLVNCVRPLHTISLGEPYILPITFMALVAADIIAHIIFLIMLAKKIKKGNVGLLPFLCREIITLTILLCFVINGIFGFVLSGVAAEKELADRDALIEVATLYLVLMMVQALIVVMFSFAPAYVSLMLFLVGKENRPLTPKDTFSTGWALMVKYNLVFWFGCAWTTIMLASAIISAITVSSTYLTIVALYVFMLSVRIPVFFWRQHIDRKYTDPYENFRQRHKILIFGGIFFALYFFVVFLIGPSSIAAMSNTKSAFLLYAFFVPWALFRLAFSIIGFVKQRRGGDPILSLFTQIDFMVALFTVTSTLFYIANWIRGDLPLDQMPRPAAAFYLIGLILILANTMLVLYLGIRSLVIGIRGIRGKRLKFFQSHEKLSKAVDKALVIKEEEAGIPTQAQVDAIEAEISENASGTPEQNKTSD